MSSVRCGLTGLYIVARAVTIRVKTDVESQDCYQDCYEAGNPDEGIPLRFSPDKAALFQTSMEGESPWQIGFSCNSTAF
jgi:hypothetical protein